MFFILYILVASYIQIVYILNFIQSDMEKVYMIIKFWLAHLLPLLQNNFCCILVIIFNMHEPIYDWQKGFIKRSLHDPLEGPTCPFSKVLLNPFKLNVFSNKF